VLSDVLVLDPRIVLYEVDNLRTLTSIKTVLQALEALKSESAGSQG
jgi:hypothetical protein